MLDNRLILMRDGVAARSLQGIVPADRYVKTTLRQAAVPSTALRRAAAADAEQLDQGGLRRDAGADRPVAGRDPGPEPGHRRVDEAGASRHAE